MSGAATSAGDWLREVRFDASGLVPVIAQQHDTGRVLMLAWADRHALEETVRTRQANYFSRSRNRAWKKGEESGNTQRVLEVRLDCDGDAVIYLVEQAGGAACHTGRESCFYRRLDGEAWQETDPVRVDPARMYRKERT